MSALTLRPGDGAALHSSRNPLASFMRRLIAAREVQARRRIAEYLAWCSDERLKDLGLSDREIAAIRTGTFPGDRG